MSLQMCFSKGVGKGLSSRWERTQGWVHLLLSPLRVPSKCMRGH